MKRLPTTLPHLAVFVAIMLHGLVEVPYFKNDLALLFWIWMGLLIVSPPPAGQKVKIAI